jgi:pimeloyl-ACP methyl ester carboxylesterase
MADREHPLSNEGRRMITAPETRYARTADGVHIAYQVLGEGPLDLIFVLGWTTNVEALWEEPDLARFLQRLAAAGRLILFDKRGIGLSDRVPEDRLPPLEMRMDDVRAVMDAVGSERAVVMGISEGGPMAMLFAATYPERTIALVLLGTDSNWSDFTDEDSARSLADIDAHWGTEDFAREAIRDWGAPGREGDERLVSWLASCLRRAASPGAAMALQRMNAQMDVTSTLSSIHVPTIIVSRTGDRDFPIEGVRTLASRIAGARLVETPGTAHFFWVGDQDGMLAPIETFVKELAGHEAVLDRMLATVLFTDIVDSTAQSAAIGDHAWRDVRESHDSIIRGQLARFRGREIKTMGDGFLATFDGPGRAVQAATAMVEAVKPLGVEIRAGLHTGEIELEGDDIAGLAVAIAARVGAKAGSSEVLVSQTVKDLTAGSGLTFEDVGEQELKGVPDRWHLYRVLAT